MSKFLKSSIGQKFLMSITGLFLITFLAVHLGLNLLMLFDSSGELFNNAAHFMATTPVMRVMELMLAAGFIIHILYAGMLTLQNQAARGSDKYAKVDQSNSSKWASRNMFVLGSLVFIFLAIHLANFFWKLKFGEAPEITIDGVKMHDTYALVSGLFIQYWWYDVLYVLGAIFLGLHLHHAFWSAFQTLGLSNKKWRIQLETIGNVYTIIIAAGFTIIPLYFLFIV